MISSLTIRNHYTTELKRCINKVILLLPLNKPCKIYLNGSTITIEDGIIINNADLFQLFDVQDLMELSLPLPLFFEKDSTLSTSFFDFNHIQFVEQFRNLVLDNLHSTLQDEAPAHRYISNIIEFLIKEAKVTSNNVYIPPLNTKHPLVQQITEYIHQHIYDKLSTKNVSNAFYISQSYISILFSNVLNMNFKHYTTSLRIALSLFDLLHGNKSIYDVAVKYQFANVSTYSKHFKHYIHIPPKRYVHYFRQEYFNEPKQIDMDKSKLLRYFAQIQKSSQQMNQIVNTINLSTLTFNEIFKEPYTFILLDNFDDLIHFVSSISSQSDVHVFPKSNIVIQDTNINHLNGLKLQQVLSSIHHLINKNFYITLKVTPTILTEQSNTVLRKLLIACTKQLSWMTLYLDFTVNEVRDLPQFIDEVKQNYPKLKIGIKLDTILTHCSHITQIHRFMSLLNVDFYYINLNLIALAELISQKDKRINSDDSLKARILMFINNMSSEHAKKLILINLTHSALKQCYNDDKQDTHVVLAQFLIEFNQLVGGFGYPYYSDNHDRIMLFNQFQSAMPVVHIYGLLSPFYKQQLAILPYAYVTKTHMHYHLLLFNHLNRSSFSVNINHNFIKPFPILSRLINSEHGVISNLIPQNLNQTYLDNSLLKQINRSNYPRLKLTMHSFKDPLIFKLPKSSLLYIKISIN
ncbi:helix-turn-helix domain-containing protein [Staphylococcus edaphicus]|uniref:AraC family transcriptional regulator n=1 Tax=Staphylococcus edaphicus TaxID=1955013 RepID=A0A2C6WKP7_9STAP|nr:helix-turn-helix domain-containing protein [Staphylococcus edaphicus]PHK49670.1 AraC family transcriptional regulator [Staphylococcus edaphicus]UQW81907.1 helix-turn-helix domain-containing protein [Staphylococcus edaphicus]